MSRALILLINHLDKKRNKDNMNHPIHQISEYMRNGKPCAYLNIEDLHHEAPFDTSIIHTHDHYLVYLFESGHSVHNIELESYECGSYTVSMVFPHQYHLLKIDPDAKGTVLLFNEELFCSEMLRKEVRAYSINMREEFNFMTLTPEQFAEVNQLFQLSTSMIDTTNVIQMEQTRHLVKLIILKLMDFAKKKDLTQQEFSESNTYLEFIDLLEEGFMTVRTASEYAEKLSITPKKLNQLCKKYGQQTTLHQIHDRIFLEIKRLLTFSSLSHKEIAYTLKFDSPSAFHKFVLKRSGLTPTALQKQLAQIYKSVD